MVTNARRAHRLALILAIPLIAAACGRHESPSPSSLAAATATAPPAARFVIAEGSQPVAAPVYVANEKGFWKELGLDVQLVPFTSGRLCLDAVLGGKADAGTMAETPVVHAAFRDAPIHLVATIHYSEKNTKVIARRDQGIARPGDLKGRKVGVSVGTNGEFFMDRYLARAGLSRRDVTVVNLRPEEMVAAIGKGDVAACFTWEPHVQNAVRLLGDKGVVFPNDGIYGETYNIVVSRTAAETKANEVRLLLQGLAKATAYIHDHPDDSVRIVAARIGVDEALLRSIWSDYTFRVSLDEPLLRLLDEEAAWAKANGTAPRGAMVPDFRRLVLTAPLKANDPAAVTIR